MADISVAWAALATAGLSCLLIVIQLALSLGAARERRQLRLLAEQGLAGQRAEAETIRRHLADSERALLAAIRTGTTEALARAFTDMTAATQAVGTALGDMRVGQARAMGDTAALLESKLREMAETQATRLAAIQASVNEQLHAAVEKQMSTSFQRVIDQFAAVQKAMGDVQAVTAQIGDLRRLFSNVKTRGGWGETQLRSLLEDILPDRFDTNVRVREGSDDRVEFAIRMPGRGGERPYLALDAKFPVEDYERLLLAAEAGDAEGERAARKGLEVRLRLEAKKIAEKYISPPTTADFAVLYLPTDGLYAEVARVPGLIDEIGRLQRVLVLGPSLAPALLRTIHLGFITLTLEQRADDVRRLLGATRTEMARMDGVLEKLGKQAGAFSNTIDDARVRTRAVGRKLREVEAAETGDAERLLELDGME